MGASKPCEWTTGGQRADLQSCRHASRPTRARVKIVIPTASSSPSPVHTRDSAGRAQQCWHRRRRFMTCGFFPPSMHVRPSFGLQESSFPPSIFLWRYSLGVCLSTTRNDPLTAGTFHSVPRGRRAVMPSLQPSRIIYGRRRHSGIYHPSSSSPVFGWLAGSDVFDLTGVALFGRALSFSHLYSPYMEDGRQSNPLQQCHTTPPPPLPLSEYLKCRRRCHLLNYLK